VEDLTHGLDLNSIGHEYDSKIALGLKVVAAAALAALVGPNAGAAEPVAEAVGKAITEKAVEVAVTKAEAAGSTEMIASGTSCAIASAKDVDNKESKAKNESRIEKVMQNYAKEAGKQYDNINKLDEAAGKKTGQSDGKGLIEGIVGLVTDKAWGKPQRRRAIHNYLDESLMPQFKNAMTMSCNQVIKMLKDMLLDAAKATIAEKKLALEDMNMQHETQKELFAKRLSTLRDYKNELLTQ
jgi:hypothetical protein